MRRSFFAMHHFYNPVQPRPLGLPMDQCSVGMCGSGGLKKLFKLFLEPIYDPAHRPMNDLFKGLRLAGDFNKLLAMKSMYGVTYACWGTGKWHTEIIDFLTMLLKEYPEEIKALWERHFLPLVVRDMGKQSEAHDPGFGDDLLTNIIRDVFYAKGPKMAICEWGSWIKCTKYWDPRFHRRAFVFLLMCMFYNLLQGTALARSLKLDSLTDKLASCGVGGAKSVKEKTHQQLKACGSTTLHAAFRLYLEGWPLQRAFRKMWYVSLPVFKSYQGMRDDSKSHGGMIQYYATMATSEALRPICETLGVLADTQVLKSLGFAVEAADVPLVTLKGGSMEAMCRDEAVFAEELVYSVCCHAGSRLQSLLWHILGLPGLLPAVLDVDARASASVRRRLQHIDSAFHAAIEQAANLDNVKEQLDSSFLSDPIPKQAMHILRGTNFDSTPAALKEAIVGLFGVGQTVMNEQGNRAARWAAEQNQDNKKAAPTRLFLAPYKDKVASCVNKFDEFTHHEHTAADARASGAITPDKKYFAPDPAGTKLPYAKMKSDKKEAPWDTTTPSLMGKMYSHIVWWQQCQTTPADWAQTGRLWLTQFFCTGMVVRWKVGDTFFLMLTPIARGGFLAWVINEHKSIGKTYYACPAEVKAKPEEMFTILHVVAFMNTSMNN